VQDIDENEDKTKKSIWYWFNTRPTKKKKKCHNEYQVSS